MNDVNANSRTDCLSADFLNSLLLSAKIFYHTFLKVPSTPVPARRACLRSTFCKLQIQEYPGIPAAGKQGQKSKRTEPCPAGFSPY